MREQGAWGDWLVQRAESQVRQALASIVAAERLVITLEELRPRLELTAGVRLSLTDMVLRAATITALEHPEFVAGPHRREGPGIDIGLVTLDYEGRPGVVVIEDSHGRSVVELAGERAEAATRAPDPDGRGAALLVSNLGPHGIDQFIPGAGPTTAPILGLGRIRRLQGGAEMWVSLSIDARYVRLPEAATALRRCCDLLERPSLLIV